LRGAAARCYERGMARAGMLVVALCVASAFFSTSPASASWWQGWESIDDPRLSQPTFGETVVEDFAIEAGDGTRLKARVIRPVTPAGARIPAILHLSPYLGPSIPRHQIAPELQKHRYAERGYALVAVSIRGTGGSGGCIDYQGDRDLADIDPILDTIAGRPWSNGRIGGLGLSWDGTTLNQAALTGNPHLETIVPAAAITDWYRWSFMDGVPTWFQGYTYNVYAPPVVSGATFMALADGGSPPGAETAERVCEQHAPAVAAQVEGASTGVRSAWWDEREMVRRADRIRPDLAVLQVAGWRDVGVSIDHLDGWDPALRERLPNYRLLVGDWNHMWPDTPNIPAASNPDVTFSTRPLTTWPALLLRWFDHWLKDKPTGIAAMPAAVMQDDHGDWHAEDALEPSRAVTDHLYPAGDGTLRDAPADGTARFVDDGQNVDPRGNCLYVGVGFIIGCAPTPTENAQFFLGPPLSRATRFSGSPRARLRLSHSMPRGHVGVSLYSVSPEEKWTPLTYGISSLNLGPDDRTYDHLEPGVEFEHAVDLLARDVLVPAGHRIGVAIGSNVSYPRGIGGNGYAPVPTGGTTELRLGAGTAIELDRLAGKTKTIPLR
jgi:X-Pro dipeptidyl-peptidase